MFELDPRLTIWEVFLILGQAAWIPVMCFLIPAVIVALTNDKES